MSVITDSPDLKSGTGMLLYADGNSCETDEYISRKTAYAEAIEVARQKVDRIACIWASSLSRIPRLIVTVTLFCATLARYLAWRSACWRAA